MTIKFSEPNVDGQDLMKDFSLMERKRTMEKIARVMAVHRDRFELCLEDETIYARLRKSEFMAEGKTKTFPTVGDFVEIGRNKQ